MKRIALFTAALIVLSFGLAYAQDSMDLTSTEGIWDGGTKADVGDPIVFRMAQVVGADNVLGQSNGFEIYISATDGGAPDPAGTFQTVAGTALVDYNGLYFDGGFFINTFATTDGAGADTIGFGGFGIGKNLPAGTVLDPALEITTQLSPGFEGQYLCIDSAFYPPGGAWLWSTTAGDKEPAWGGPYCYLIEDQPNAPAVFTTVPAGQLSFDHCVTATFDFNGEDPDPAQCDPPGDGSISFSMVSGPGSIDAATGVWSYSAMLADVGGPINVTVHVEDACGAGNDHSFEVVFTNQAPTIACGPLTPIGKGQSVDVQINADDVDCDPGTFSIASVSPVPVGTYSISPSGLLTFNTDDADAPGGPQVFDFVVEYTDGDLTASCTQQIEVLFTEPFEIQIEKTHGTFQGGHEFVDVTVNKGSEEMWGFDFLIAYDASALSFQTAVEGTVYDSCGWEYFTYRYGANGNCSNACPTGLLRVVGLAETNNGANHPSCYDATGRTLFTLDFLVSDNRTFECQYVPVRFYWMDCGDNAVSFRELSQAPEDLSQTLGISRFVYDLEMMEISDPAGVFPTYLGAPEICLEGDKEVPVRFVDFVNGGIDIVCADSIDDRGDLNLNGEPNEIADVVLYSNYFVYGPVVLGTGNPYQAAVAASDVNADGIPLSIADLVYQLRIIVGDALPYPKVAATDAVVTVNNDAINVAGDMGAAYVVVEGNATPELLIDGVEMKYAFDAEKNVTRVLVYGDEQGAVVTGTFLDANGQILNIEMATYEGQPVNSKLIPSTFALEQNYPNPFNPTTTISFQLPQASDYTLTVYNVTGQQVRQYTGSVEAGVHTVDVDGAELASGVYFYNLVAGDHNATKKMVLLK